MALNKRVQKLTPQNRIKELEAIVERQAETIERLRCKKLTLPTGKRDKEKGETFLRVICSDTHGAHEDHTATKAFFQDLDMLRPAEVVHLGDILDCGGFLAQHHTLGVVPECAYTYEEDVDAGNCFLDRIAKHAPDAIVDVILGNHDWRVEKEIIKWTLRNQKDSKFLTGLISPAAVLGLEKRGIRCVRPDTFYDGLNVRGTIKRDHCAMRHGMRAGVNATAQILNDMGCNVVHGHTHRMIMASRETVKGLIAGWSCPCLCVIRPLYGMTDISGWAHGYIIQVVSETGFLTLQIPIINGVSYLQPLVKHLNIK